VGKNRDSGVEKEAGRVEKETCTERVLKRQKIPSNVDLNSKMSFISQRPLVREQVFSRLTFTVLQNRYYCICLCLSHRAKPVKNLRV
jgi:hypothetical protein